MNLWKVSAIDTNCKCLEKSKKFAEKYVTLKRYNSNIIVGRMKSFLC
jgi:hypothetical protein